MTFSYTLPSSGVFASKKDEIRFLIQDTVLTDFSLQDEEISYAITFQSGSVYMAAADCCDRIATLYHKQSVASKSVGDLSLSYTYHEAGSRYTELAAKFQKGPKSLYAPVQYADTNTSGDTIDPDFYKGQFDNRYI